MSDDLEALIERVVRDNDWSRVVDAAAFAPEARAAGVSRRWPTAGPAGRSQLAWWLGVTATAAGDTLLLELLATAVGSDAAAVLRALTARRIVAPTAELSRLLGDTGAAGDAVRESAVAAAGLAGDLSLAPLVAAALDGPARMHAAIALGRMRATAYTAALLARLPAQRDLMFGGFVVGLELMGDAAAIAPLRAMVPAAGRPTLWQLHHALVRLSGHDPVLPVDADEPTWVAAVQQAWATAALDAPRVPTLTDVVVSEGDQLTFTMRDGLGVVRIDYDAPPPGSSWPQWDKSLRVAGQDVYAVGSECGTCETTLRHAGWPPPLAARHGDAIRAALHDLRSLEPATLEALAPLLATLRSGRYVAALTDLDLVRVDHAAGSWWHRRVTLRVSEDGERDQLDDDQGWPGVTHLELREPLPGTPPTFGAIVPSQSLDELRPDVVDAKATAIRAGARPAALALAWTDRREVGASFAEQFLIGMVLDGHHRLAAYAALAVPARVLLICRLEDTWGPPGDRARWFRDTAHAARVARSVTG